MPADHPHQGHRSRLKRRFLKEGLDSFEDHNVLELVLFYAVPRKDTNPTAHKLIQRFGSLNQVLDAPISDLVTVDGVSENAATLLKAIGGITKKYLNAQLDDTAAFETIEQLGQYFQRKYIGTTCEEVYVLLLDGNRRPLGCEWVSTGGISSVDLDLRKIVSISLRNRANGIVLAHNHPAASCAPSNDDVVATTYLKNALIPVDITLVDHIIVSQGGYSSLREMGYL